MNREGCAPGYEHRGDACYLKNRVRNIPFSVNTKAGCLNFGGKWIDDFSVCVMRDIVSKDSIEGYTAPIRGLYFMWWAQRYNPKDMDYDWHNWWEEMKEDEEFQKRKPNPRDFSYEGYTKGCLVKDASGYPDKPDECNEATSGASIFDLEIDYDNYPMRFDGAAMLLRDKALERARMFMENFDRAALHEYKYFDQAGRKLPMWRPDAIPMEIDVRGTGWAPAGKAPEYYNRKPFGIRRHKDEP